MNNSNSSNDDVFLNQEIKRLSNQTKDVDQAIEKLLIEINSLKEMVAKRFQNHDSNIQEIKINAKQQGAYIRRCPSRSPLKSYGSHN